MKNGLQGYLRMLHPSTDEYKTQISRQKFLGKMLVFYVKHQPLYRIPTLPYRNTVILCFFTNKQI